MRLNMFYRFSYVSSNSPSIKRRSYDRPASSQGYFTGYLRPGSSASSSGPHSLPYPQPLTPQFHRRRLSDNHYHQQRASLASQTSSLHTALSELAGDVEVVDMEDGALTGDHYAHHEDYAGEQRPAPPRSNGQATDGVFRADADGSEATMAAGSSGEGFWFSDPREHYVHQRHHLNLHQARHDEARCMMGAVMLDEDPYAAAAAAGDETYLPYVYGMEGPDPGVNWQERCMELEMSLQRFRDQAGKIRGLLREKVSPRSPVFLRMHRRHLALDRTTR